MIRGATIPIVLDFTGEDVDFTAVDSIKVTFEQGGHEVTKIPTVDDAVTLTVNLTQAESLSFKAPSVVYPLGIQVNWLNGGVRYASDVTEITVGKQLFDEVMS